MRPRTDDWRGAEMFVRALLGHNGLRADEHDRTMRTRRHVPIAFAVRARVVRKSMTKEFALARMLLSPSCRQPDFHGSAPARSRQRAVSRPQGYDGEARIGRGHDWTARQTVSISVYGTSPTTALTSSTSPERDMASQHRRPHCVILPYVR